MVIKLTGLGVKGYFSNRFNLFDCFLVLASIVEMANISSEVNIISAFRSIRVLRVFKLVSKAENLRVLLNTLARTSSDMIYFTMIQIIFLIGAS